MKNLLKKSSVYLGAVIFGTVIIIGVSIPIIRMYHDDPQSASIFVAIGTIIMAIFTFALAFLTYYSVRSFYDKENRDRKEKYLNEIIEWAIELRKTYLGKEFEIILVNNDNASTAYHFNLTQLYAKGKYINNISSIFGKSLIGKIEKAMKALYICIGLNLNDKDVTKNTMEEYPKKTKHEVFIIYLIKIQELADIIIDEATKTKTIKIYN